MPTEFITTINKTGEDYATIASWDAAIQADLTSTSTLVFSHGGIAGTIADGANIIGSLSGVLGTCAHATDTQIMLTGINGGTFASGEDLGVVASTGNKVTASDAGDSVVAVLEFYDDGGVHSEGGAVITGWTTSQDNNIIVRPADGHGHNGLRTDGSAGNGVLIEHNTSNYCMRIEEPYTLIEGIQCVGLGAHRAFFTTIVSDDITIKDVIIRDYQASRGAIQNWQKVNTMINCIIYNVTGGDAEAYDADGGSGNLLCYSCVAYRCGQYGFKARIIASNCAAMACSDGAFEAGATGDYNISDDGSAPGANSIAGTDANQWLSVLFGSENFHIKDTSADIYDAGINLGTTPYGVQFDFEGNTRTRYDIGADEFTGGSTSATATPAVSTNTIVVNDPVITITVIENATATATTAISSVIVNTPSLSSGVSTNVTTSIVETSLSVLAVTVSSSNSAFATPSLVIVSYEVPAVTATTSTIESANATPSIVTSRIVVNNASVNAEGSINVSPSRIESYFEVNSPVLKVSRSSTTTPSFVIQRLLVNSPITNIIVSSNASVDSAFLDVVVLSASSGQITSSGIVTKILRKSKIEKRLTLLSNLD